MKNIFELQKDHPDKVVPELPKNYMKDYSYSILAQPMVTDSTIEWFILTPLSPTEKIEAEAVKRGLVLRRRQDMFDELSWRYERANREQRMSKPLTISFEELDTVAQALADITNQEGYPWDVEFPSMPN